MTVQIRIGTSGWHYAHWRDEFYPPALRPAQMLGYYARQFDAVEINNSFYRLPVPEVLAAWRDATPPGFCFAAKASRYVTHMKKLTDPAGFLERLLPNLETLGPKLGPILFQLPPRWRCDAGRLEAFLSALPPVHRYAFEFRDPSWHEPHVLRLLQRYNIAFCAFDLGGLCSITPVTADFAYVRLHGPGVERYDGRYGAELLRPWARRIEAWGRTLRAVHVYFDNDRGAHAPHDARTLRSMVLGSAEARMLGSSAGHPQAERSSA